MRHAFRFLTASLIACGFLTAAQAAQSLRFTAFSVSPIGKLVFAPSAGAALQPLEFRAYARSPRYEFRGTMPLRFTDTTGKVVAEASIPPEITDALLVFFTPETPTAAGLRYQVTVLDDGAGHHGSGALAVLNLSGLNLSGIIGRHAVILQAGTNPTLSIGHSARIALRATIDGATHPSYDDNISTGPGQRALLILLPPYEKGSIEAGSRVLIDDAPMVSITGKW